MDMDFLDSTEGDRQGLTYRWNPKKAGIQTLLMELEKIWPFKEGDAWHDPEHDGSATYWHQEETQGLTQIQDWTVHNEINLETKRK